MPSSPCTPAALPHDTVTPGLGHRAPGTRCCRAASRRVARTAAWSRRGLVRVRVRVRVRVGVRVRLVARTAAWSNRARARSRMRPPINQRRPPTAHPLAQGRLGPWLPPRAPGVASRGSKARDRREGGPWARKESPLRRRGGGCGGALVPCPNCPHLTPPWTTQAAAEGAARGQPRRATGHGGVGRRRPELTR